MIRTLINRVFWALVLLCVLLALNADGNKFEPEMKFAGIFGIIAAYILRSVALWLTMPGQLARDTQRTLDLQEQVRAGQTVDIRGGSGLGWLLLWLPLAVTLSLPNGSTLPPPPLIAVAVLLWICVLAVAITAIPLLGGRILTISLDGLQSPVFGTLRWDEIEGIDLREFNFKGHTVNHRLHLLVPDLAKLAPRMHPVARLEHRIVARLRSTQPPQLRLRLAGTSESPGVIAKLCERVWSQQTGNASSWKAWMPQDAVTEFRSAARRRRELAQLAIQDPAKLIDTLNAEAGHARKSQGEKSDPSLAAIKARLNDQIDAQGFKEALRLQREENKKRIDDLRNFTPPPPRTHWLTWLAATLAVPFLACFVWLLYRSMQ